MTFSTLFLITTILSLWISPITSQFPSSLTFTSSPSPSPSPDPQIVNLTNLLSVEGPFQTFLNLLVQANVIQTFENQANNTNQGITIFAPTDSAFAMIEKPSLTNLTKDQVKSLLLYHALPQYYSLSDFKDLISKNPVSTLAGGNYTLNITETNKLIEVKSDWSNPKINSSIYTTYPIAVYELDSVLFPKAIVTEAPVLTPTPTPQGINLTNLLSSVDTLQTFLNLLVQTNVLQSFQNQANNTKQGITIFAPTNSAFTEIQKPSLTNLTKDQVESLLLYHAFPQYYSLYDFKDLSSKNPLITLAGEKYTLNITETSGLIQVKSDWTNPNINKIYTTYPIAIYELNNVLLPKAIVTEAPVLTPTPSPQIVNLTNLLSVEGPFQTFLNLLVQSNVIQTFQNQANNTNQGITIFAPIDSAFAEIQKPSLTNLTEDQVKSLLLYHALPQYYSISEFKDLSKKNPVSTLAGGQYTLNITETNGLIQVNSDWTNPKINNSIYMSYPIVVYELDSVLLPKAIITEAPVLTPAPAPQIVNITNLLSIDGPFQIFLNLLVQTNVIQTFQKQANNTKQGITIFAPINSAFAEIQKPSLTNLTKDQVESLLLYHAFPQYYSLYDFKDLITNDSVSTLAGEKYKLNITNSSGLIQVKSDWTNPKISSSVYTTYPVAIYEINSVLLPKEIVTEAPVLTPGTAPAPGPSPNNNGASSSHIISVCRFNYLLVVALGAIMLMI